MRRFLPSCIVVMFLCSIASAVSLPKPKRDPVPSSAEQAALIREGVRLHDAGDFSGAIAKYEQVLKLNPHNVAAMYEMSYSQFMLKDYQMSLSMAMKGAEYRSPALPGFYMTIGNCLDALGKPKDALQVYQAGIKSFPDYGMLYFNMGVTQVNLGKTKEAVGTLEKSVRLNPNHPSSYYTLSRLYLRDEQRVPALLLALRFLVLEPRSPRAVQMLPGIEELLRAGVNRDSPQGIKLTVPTPQTESAKKDTKGSKQGSSLDWAYLNLSMARSTSMISKGDSLGEIQLDADELQLFFRTFSGDLATKKPALPLQDFYLPYYLEMSQKELLLPFCYFIFQGKNDEFTLQWIKSHPAEIQAFADWTKSYQWSRPTTNK